MTWTPLVANAKVFARPNGLWTLVLEYVSAPTTLQIVAGSTPWQYAAGQQCGPSGDWTAMIARSRCIHPAGPVGALIGKIGGSNAGLDDGKLFLVGEFCIVEVPETSSGPLYLTINDEPTGFANNDGILTVTVARLVGAT